MRLPHGMRPRPADRHPATHQNATVSACTLATARLVAVVSPALLYTSFNMNTRRKAQRVSGCGVLRSRLAVTQRRETDTRSPCVGNPLADLPSGER